MGANPIGEGEEGEEGVRKRRVAMIDLKQEITDMHMKGGYDHKSVMRTGIYVF